MEKIDFKEASKDDGPIDRMTLLKRMQSLDEGVIAEYIDGLSGQIGMLHTWRDVFACVKSSTLVQRLIDGMDEKTFGNLVKIVNLLSRQDILKQIRKLLDQSFCFDEPHAGDEKVALLLEKILKIPLERREQVVIAYSNLSLDLRHFSELLAITNMNLTSKENYLSKLNELQMNRLLEMADEIEAMK